MDEIRLGNDVPKHVKGVACNVKSCVYNENECYCTANKINVGPCTATCCTETICATYETKGKN